MKTVSVYHTYENHVRQVTTRPLKNKEGNCDLLISKFKRDNIHQIEQETL